MSDDTAVKAERVAAVLKRAAGTAALACVSSGIFAFGVFTQSVGGNTGDNAAWARFAALALLGVALFSGTAAFLLSAFAHAARAVATAPGNSLPRADDHPHEM